MEEKANLEAGERLNQTDKFMNLKYLKGCDAGDRAIDPDMVTT